MSGYSRDLRERVIRLRAAGNTQQWIADTLSISISSVKRYLQRYVKHGDVGATEQGRMKPNLSDEQLPELVAQLESHAEASLEQHVALWEASHG